MTQIRIAGLCLVVALALGAVAAPGAMATAPEYGRCVKKKTKSLPALSNSKCTLEAKELKTANFEWVPGAGKTKFETKGGIGLLTSVNGQKVECKTESSTGEFFAGNNKEAGNMAIKFNECESLGQACTSPGAKAGELVTNDVEALVGWENKALKKTAIELHPGKNVTSGLFIEFECGGLPVKVRGAVLVPVKNDAMKTSEILKFKQKAGKQKPEKWEESSGKVILEASFKGGTFEQSGQEIESTLKELAGEQPLELNAVL
jgi:hypothetical protein